MSNSPKRITGVKSAHRNRHLFSNHYLDNLLPRDPDWEAALPEAKKSLSWLQDVYSKERRRLPEYDEIQLEERWFEPILSHLAHVSAEHPRIKLPPRQVKTPDYVFFPDDAARQRVVGAQKSADYASDALSVGEVKRWDVPLGRKEQGGRGAFEAQNPSVQIAHYVRTLGLTWGVLTNGRLWRLVHKDTSQRLSIYYEIDLVELLSQRDADSLRYFTVFFRQAAFKPDARGRVFLDDALGASREHTLELEEYLKENAQRALERLMQGFLDLKDNGLGESDLPEVYDNSLHLLYRLFFILYAESQGLLPLENDKYRAKHSLRGMLEDVEREDAPAAPTSIILWTRLQTLFRIVNGDAPELNSRLVVPRYSGGLFNPNRRPFLEVRAIGDQALAETLDLICRRQTEVGSQLVDYRTLTVRHLGSILGELLEFRPRYASKSMVTIRSRKGVHWIVERSVDRKDSDSRGAPVSKALDRRDAGQVYLETGRGMAKATGSHYTPHHIVAHIVENTVGPLLEEAKERVSAQIEKRRRKSAKAAAGQTLVEEILSLKVLDPAVGSAQFLLEAAELLALELATDPYVEARDVPEEDLAHWRRRVVERCIYGVDKNPLAVELAKLSLWLATVSADRPLVYLDHHLRCGDSLLGARVADLGWAPPVVLSKKARTQLEQQKAGQMNMFEYLLGQQLPAVMARILEITDADSDSYDTVEAKEAADRAVRALKAPFEAVADLWVGAFFGGEVSQADYEEALGLVGKRNELLSLLSVQWAQQMSHKRRFFHWELAFPEVFYDRHGQPLGDRAGFDAVVGNPPYRAPFTMPQTSDPGRIEDYLEGQLNIQTAIGRKQEPCRLFVARALTLLREGGRLGFVVPLSLVADTGSRSLRRVVLEHHGLIQIDAFPNRDDPAARVFAPSDLAAAVFIIERGPSTLTPAKIILHPGSELQAVSYTHLTLPTN